MMKLPFINRIFPSYRSRIVAVIIGGIIVGGGALFMYMLRAHTYLGDDPAACVNCHIMSPYYATWFHSSHSTGCYLQRLPCSSREHCEEMDIQRNGWYAAT